MSSTVIILVLKLLILSANAKNIQNLDEIENNNDDYQNIGKLTIYLGKPYKAVAIQILKV